jgi:branched-chain amino acid transport system ATP-binding protein
VSARAPATTRPALELRDLGVGYVGVPVVRGVNLHVDPGEIVALLGPNGAGKTTTLMAVSGLLPALSGHIEVLGAPVSTRQPHRNARRGLAHVPEDRALFPGLSTLQNVQLGDRTRRGAAKAAMARFPELERLRSRAAGLLSGGEQQMLALARALASHPRLLLVDELSLGLAPIIAERLVPMLREIALEREMSVLLVEQHVHLALAVADRAYVMVHGEIVLEGPARELEDQPHVLEARYLGTAQS